MPPSKRKYLEGFDPNKSDSEDENYASDNDKPQRSSKKPRSKFKKSSGTKRRRTKYGGSDISDDEVDDSESEEVFSAADDNDEEEPELDEESGRPKRKAKNKAISYEESAAEEDEEAENSLEEEEEDAPPPAKAPKKRIITLKLPASAKKEQAQRSTRRSSGTEPTSASRRNTRAHTEEHDEELVALTTSGNHVEVVRSSRSPETHNRTRVTRGGKGLKKVPSVVKEEAHETSSFEQGDAPGEDDDDDLPEILPEDMEEVTQVMSSLASRGDPPPPSSMDELARHDAATDAEAVGGNDSDKDDDDDDVPVARAGRARPGRKSVSEVVEEVTEDVPVEGNTTRTSRRLRSRATRKTGEEPTSDFEPAEESAEDEMSGSDGSPTKRKAGSPDTDSTPRRGRPAGKGKSKSNRSSRRRGDGSEDEIELDRDELAEEAEELKAARRENRRRPRRESPVLYEPAERRARKPVNYKIQPMDVIYAQDDDAAEGAATPSRGGRGRRGGPSQAWERNLYTTYGPFGGAGGPPPLIGGPWGTGAAGNVDSDSSDDENQQRPHVGGAVGMTPTSAMPGLLPGLGQTHNADAGGASLGTPANFGRVKSQKALADADPLGVDQNIDFSKVGGLAGHIDALKEMVQMPLLYPELFTKFHVTPPRGVLFHGPPGTGKTLLARALAAQVGSGGRKITFYMRKGADALSKWVGEAERQLRLLFEEARKTQPSIIFFDEIDGLAPVRSSKQEQIHASIVSTLLALMDGMDGRGQVIVIGATNRPDNIDPALRRPGRFDREFYFPLPDFDGRLSILNIHTQDWGVDDAFKTSLAHVTKGYGGADLRALCTEAALNAIQRTYPQIYSSNEKLIVDPDKIKITAKDFMISIKKMVPSSERSTSSGAAALPRVVEPLLREQLGVIEGIVDSLIPIKKKTTALQEAMYEQYDDADHGFGRETLQQDFEKSRVFRPRLLIEGKQGMGQAYIGAALLNHFEGLHVQNFDLPTIFADSTRSAETAIVQLFAEVKRHKPSVIYLPNIQTWYTTVSEAVITTFLGLLRAIPPTDPVLVLGIADEEFEPKNPMLRDLFGYSRKNRFTIRRTNKPERTEFFQNVIEYIKKAPKDFPDPVNRKLRKLPVLPIAPPPPPRVPSKEEIKAIKKKDHMVLNLMKTMIQPIMDQLKKNKYRRFRNAVLPLSSIQYLLDEQDPNYVRADIVGPQRPYELDKDKEGVMGLRETATGKFFYNLEIVTIEERLSNGFYARPKDFLADIVTLAKDAKNIGDKDRLIQANELVANVEVDIAGIEADPRLADVENVYQRQLQRAKAKAEKQKKREQADAAHHALVTSDIVTSDIIQPNSSTTGTSSGPVILGELIPGRRGPLVAGFNLSSSLSNGDHRLSDPLSGGLSNGSLEHFSNGTDDVHMGGTDDAHIPPQARPDSQGMLPPTQSWGRVTSKLSTGIFTHSQTSAFQELPHDTSPTALINDASTTTSGKKTSPSNRTSDGVSSQATNGKPGSQYSPLGDSQLPDTQRASQDEAHSSDEQQWAHSQAHGIARGYLLPQIHSQTPSSGSQPYSQPPRPPLFDAPSRPGAKSSSQESSQKDLIMDEAFINGLLDTFVEKSSGCSVEQLEQINRELMDTLWHERGNYNRTSVATTVMKAFNEVIRDIEEMQRVLQASQDSV